MWACSPMWTWSCRSAPLPSCPSAPQTPPMAALPWPPTGKQILGVGWTVMHTFGRQCLASCCPTCLANAALSADGKVRQQIALLLQISLPDDLAAAAGQYVILCWLQAPSTWPLFCLIPLTCTSDFITPHRKMKGSCTATGLCSSLSQVPLRQAYIAFTLLAGVKKAQTGWPFGCGLWRGSGA